MKIFDVWLSEIFAILGIAFLTGVFAAAYEISFRTVLILFLIAVSGAMILFRRDGLWKLLLCAGVLMFCGAIYFHIYSSVVASSVTVPIGEKISFHMIVQNEPVISASGKYLVIDANIEKPFGGEIMVLAPVRDGIAYGDELSVEGKIIAPDTAGDLSFMIPSSVSVIARGQGFWLWQILFDARAALIRGVNRVASPDVAGFLSAIAFSAKQSLTPDVVGSMTASGTAFLATLYGMKIAVIMFFMTNILLGYIDRRVVVALAAIAGLGFALMAGAPPAAIRAAIMALMALTGTNVEQFLIAQGDNLRADVLKVGHHGSKYASSDAFLRAVNPTIAVIEVGAHNTYGHPASSTLARIASSTYAQIFRTDQDGTIAVFGGQTNLIVATEKK